MTLDAKKFGLACGVLWGLSMLVLTLVSLGTGYAEEMLGVIASVYPGYGVSLLGSVIGLVYGFLDGFIGGYVFSWFYNWLVRKGS